VPTFLDAVKLDYVATGKPNTNHDNLTATERQAIRQLKRPQDIIIKPAYKALVNRRMQQTTPNQTLKRRQNHQHTKTCHLLRYHARMHKDKNTNYKTKQHLIQSDVKPRRFYILPKVHKLGNSGHPIVSSNSRPTERISHFVDYHLQPLVHK